MAVDHPAPLLNPAKPSDLLAVRDPFHSRLEDRAGFSLDIRYFEHACLGNSFTPCHHAASSAIGMLQPEYINEHLIAYLPMNCTLASIAH